MDGLSSLRKAASIALLNEFWKLGTGTRSELSLSASLSPGAGGATVGVSSEKYCFEIPGKAEQVSRGNHDHRALLWWISIGQEKIEVFHLPGLLRC